MKNIILLILLLTSYFVNANQDEQRATNFNSQESYFLSRLDIEDRMLKESVEFIISKINTYERVLSLGGKRPLYKHSLCDLLKTRSIPQFESFQKLINLLAHLPLYKNILTVNQDQLRRYNDYMTEFYTLRYGTKGKWSSLDEFRNKCFYDLVKDESWAYDIHVDILNNELRAFLKELKDKAEGLGGIIGGLLKSHSN